MVMQWPALRDMHVSASVTSSWVMWPARNSSVNCHTAVPEPMSRPRNFPFSMGPPVTMMAGRSTLAAPISWAGVVLSHPESRTTPSSGLARRDSSTSMAIRLRYSMVVGRIRVSPRDMVGNSSGKPPAISTPRLTASATVRRWALHGVSSDQLLAIPITGRPSKSSSVNPWFRIHDRWRNPCRPSAANQSALRTRSPSAETGVPAVMPPPG